MKHRFLLLLLFFIYSSVSLCQIVNSNNLQIWLSTDSVRSQKNRIIKWYNKHDTLFSFRQIDSLKQPIFSSTIFGNGYSSIKFDGLNDYLVCDSSFSINNIYVLFSYDDSVFSSNKGALTSNSSNKVLILGLNGSTNLYSGIGSHFRSGSIQINNIPTNNLSPLRALKLLKLTSGNSKIDYGNLLIGSDRLFGGFYWKGNIVEIIGYDTLLTPSQDSLVLSYFQNKYSHPVTFNDTIFQDYSLCDKQIKVGQTWFKSYLWQNGSSEDSIIISPPSQKVSLTTTDIFNFQATDSSYVLFNRPSLFEIPSQSICLNSNLSWSTQMPHTYNFLWQDGSTDSVLTITQPGDYWVQVTDSFGCSITSDTVHIEVDSFAVKASLGADRSLCQGNRLELQEGRADAVSYQWSTGDTLPYLTIQNPGTYAVTTTNSLGCVAEDSVTIGIKGLAPSPQFTKQNVCLGDSVSFIDQSVANSGNIIQWLWDFGDGTTDTLQNPTHLYLDTGYYEVNLTVLTDSGCEASIRDTVVVFPNPVANFLVGFSCERLETQFTDSSFSPWDSIISWSWNFGDGNSSSLVEPVHVYGNSQTLQPSLRVTNSFGCQDSIALNHFVKPSPTANFSVSPPCVNDSVFIQETALGDSITNYQFTLWNNFQFSGTAFSNVFTSTGSYPLQLQVTDSNNCWDTLTKVIQIRNHPNILNQLGDTQICLFDTLFWSLPYPTQAFNILWNTGAQDSLLQIYQAGNYWFQVTDSVGCVSQSDSISVSINSFTTQANAGPDTSLCKGETIALKNNPNQLQSIAWSTGDSTLSTAIDSSGDYILTLTDTMGCVGKDSIYVLVRGEKAIVQMSFDTTCILDSTQFREVSILALGDTIVNWQWDFGNNLTDSIQHPKTYYPATGVYPIKLEVITNDQCVSEGFDTIQVYHLPNPNFSMSKACEDREVYFQNLSTTADGIMASTLWRFGDANQSTDTNNNTTFIYDSAFTVTVQLKVSNSFGCENQTAQSLKIDFTPRANILVSNHCFGVNQNFEFNSVIATPANFFWSFGDGLQSQGNKVVHEYDSVGIFDVSLIVEEATGCRDTAFQQVEVYPIPEAKSFDMQGCIGSEISFVDSSLSPVYPLSTWLWKQNDTQIDTGKMFDFTFQDTGNVEIKLLVSSSVGCSDSTVGNIYISPLPIPNFDFEPTFGAAPLEVYFFNNSQPVYESVWKYNDSIISTQNNLDFTITANGVQTIELVALNAIGCKDSVSQQLKVLPPVLDLAINNVVYELQDDGFMKLAFEVSNLGTRNVNYFEVKAETERGQNLKEIIEVNLNSGETKLISLNSLLELSPDNTFGWLCLGIENVQNEGIDDNPDNNRTCLSQENFIVRDLYPNPTNKLLNIDMIAGEVGSLDIAIFSKNGSEEALVYRGETRIGLNSITLDVANLPVGVYYARIIFKGEQVVRSFVVGE